MVHKIINLEEHYPLQKHATLECFISDISDTGLSEKPALLIVPGGGYCFVSKREADPIAFSFLIKGFNCFILTYTIANEENKPPIYPHPHLELMAAVDYLKNNHKNLYIEENKLFLIGFSAGGHLVGSYGYLYNNPELLSTLNIRESTHLKPTAICLSYPVVTLSNLTHQGSSDNLTGKDEKLIELLSIEKHIDESYPPVFLWTTKDDGCVPSENTIMLEKELSKNGVINKTILFESGPHGLSTASSLVNAKNYTEIMTWIDLCSDFFKQF